jgi:hypothetical protein
VDRGRRRGAERELARERPATIRRQQQPGESDDPEPGAGDEQRRIRVNVPARRCAAVPVRMQRRVAVLVTVQRAVERRGYGSHHGVARHQRRLRACVSRGIHPT